MSSNTDLPLAGLSRTSPRTYKGPPGAGTVVVGSCGVSEGPPSRRLNRNFRYGPPARPIIYLLTGPNATASWVEQ